MTRLIASRPSLESVVAAVVPACRWWLDELRGMVPAVILHRLIPDRPTLVLEFEAEEIRLGRIVQGGYRACGRVGADEMELAQPAPLAAALADFRPHRVELRLGAARILHQKLVLPLSPAGRLPALLRFELDRQTPFTPGQVYYGARIVERDPARKTMTAAVVLAKRKDADRALAIARRWGLAPTRLTVQGDLRWSLDFRTEPASPGANLRRHRLAIGLAVASLVFALAAWHFHAAAADDYAEALDAALSRTRPAAEAVKTQQKELAAREARIAFLDRRRNAVDAGRLLETIAAKLPDDTWITHFELSGRSVRLTGFSAESTQLPALLSALPLLSKLQLSPGREPAGSAAAPFDLSAELADGATP